jgi:hypothetical protein
MEWNSLWKQIVYSLLMTLIFFMVINVLFAQIIESTLVTAVDGDTALTTIVFLGFIMAWLVAVLVNVFISDKMPWKLIFYASVFAMLSTTLLWICICYMGVLSAYPGIIPEPATGSFFLDIVARGFVYLFSVPRVMAYYAIYISDISLFWILVSLSYAPFYAFFLYDLSRNTRKPRKKVM